MKDLGDGQLGHTSLHSQPTEPQHEGDRPKVSMLTDQPEFANIFEVIDSRSRGMIPPRQDVNNPANPNTDQHSTSLDHPTAGPGPQVTSTGQYPTTGGNRNQYKVTSYTTPTPGPCPPEGITVQSTQAGSAVLPLAVSSNHHMIPPIFPPQTNPTPGVSSHQYRDYATHTTLWDHSNMGNSTGSMGQSMMGYSTENKGQPTLLPITAQPKAQEMETDIGDIMKCIQEFGEGIQTGINDFKKGNQELKQRIFAFKKGRKKLKVSTPTQAKSHAVSPPCGSTSMTPPTDGSTAQQNRSDPRAFQAVPSPDDNTVPHMNDWIQAQGNKYTPDETPCATHNLPPSGHDGQSPTNTPPRLQPRATVPSHYADSSHLRSKPPPGGLGNQSCPVPDIQVSPNCNSFNSHFSTTEPVLQTTTCKPPATNPISVDHTSRDMSGQDDFTTQDMLPPDDNTQHRSILNGQLGHNTPVTLPPDGQLGQAPQDKSPPDGQCDYASLGMSPLDGQLCHTSAVMLLQYGSLEQYLDMELGQYGYKGQKFKDYLIYTQNQGTVRISLKA